MRKIIDISGSYELCLDPAKRGLTSHFEDLSYNDTIDLPGTTSIAHKGSINPDVQIGHLTDLYAFEGYAWFRRTVTFDAEDIAEISKKRIILRLERTRISHLWIDNKKAGNFESFIAPHVYDITDLVTDPQTTITIMVSNTDYKVPGGHMTSADTQSNWNGILGNMTITIYDSICIEALNVTRKNATNTALIDIVVNNLTAKSLNTRLSITSEIHKLTDPSNGAATIAISDADPSIQDNLILSPGQNSIQLEYDLGKNASVWDEVDPSVYKIFAEVSIGALSDKTACWFGLKEFKAVGKYFYINGRRTFLRGKHDGMIFPLTGYAPMDVDAWLKVMSTAKDYGINHYRFHTCCPPDAAFVAADLLGIYMEPEIPFWGTFTAPSDDGHDETAQQFLISEGFNILKSFSAHPSFVMMSMGNELWGSPDAINTLLGRYKQAYPDILFTQGSNNFQWTPNIQPNDDFFCGVRFTIDRQIRGSYAMCDRPLGHVQVDRPCTNFTYENAIFPNYSKNAHLSPQGDTIEIQYGTGTKRVKLTDVEKELIPSIPVISHEIGQYETFPNFNEISKYTGVLYPKNFEHFKAELSKKRLYDMAHDYFINSGKLAMACYKDELETALRTDSLAGFQILDIQDFSGQGTALVGVLDAFMENKGILSASDWRSFCSDAVLQAEFDSYIVISGQTFDFDVSLAWFRLNCPGDIKINCTLSIEDTAQDTPAIADTLITGSVRENGRHVFGKVSFSIPDLKGPLALKLTLGLVSEDIYNSYTLWYYPETDICKHFIKNSIQPQHPLIFTTVASALKAAASSHVLLLLSDIENVNSIQGTYCTDFWCYPMFRSISESMGREIPVGTMGLLIRNEHPALKEFPALTYTTPQWFDIINASRSTILDGTDIVPIVQTIDNFERNHRLGLIYDVHITDLDLTITVCTSDLLSLSTGGHIEAAQLLYSLMNYCASVQLPANAYPLSSTDFEALFNGSLSK